MPSSDGDSAVSGQASTDERSLPAWRDVPMPLKIAGLYVGFIVFGTCLLLLPWSSKDGLSLSEAAFTATSAVTVTGLSVITPADDLTGFGQAMLLLLIQFGGVGLIALTVAVLAALGVRVGMDGRALLQGDMGIGRQSRLIQLIRRIVKVVLLFELGAAALLAVVFVPEHGVGQGLWHAVFHAVSAFNHAGFDIFGNSLQDYTSNAYVLLVVSFTFILSSLGFIVYADLRAGWRWHKLTLHTKLMLVGTLVLLVVPWMLTLGLEWSNPDTLGPLQTSDKLAAGWFASVTPRTAGFATLDTAALSPATTWMVMALMIVGGGSGSTAGGIKVTTVVVLALAALAFFRKSSDIRVFRTSVAANQVQKALALMWVTLIVYLIAMFLLLATQDIAFLNLQFEAMSALATVGLSRGVTGDLDQAGRIVIMVLMLLGRLGPLTLGYVIAAQRPPLTRYPNGEIHLG